MGDPRIERQLSLEQESVELGIEAYRKMKAETDLADMTVGFRLMERCLRTFIPAIHDFKYNDKRNAGHYVHVKKFLHSIDDEVIAYLTAKLCLNAIRDTLPLQSLAITLGTALKDHLEYTNFKEQHPDYLATVEKNLNTQNENHRKVVIMRAKRMIGVEDVQWTEMNLLHIGLKCIELFIENTGIVSKVRKSTYDSTYCLEPVPEVVEWIENSHAKCELLNPTYLPMVMPPKRWESCFGGGYYSNEIVNRIKLIKTPDTAWLFELNDVDMPEVYNAINTIQETPWRINRKIYDVMDAIWQSGGKLGGVPDRDEEPLPSKFWETHEEFLKLKSDSPELIKNWKIKATQVYTRRVSVKSQRLSLARKLQIAEKFLNDPEIFFCWNLDWRGRMYPIQSFINPQADDTGKALIEFARGVPMGETGGYWLCVHLANCYGYDKVSFDDRVNWVQEHFAQIIDSATNPLDGERFWCEADSPFLFLAGCFEYHEWTMKGKDYESHIPIGMDGSCNGLQNFAGMLRCEKSGKEVNLIPSAKPSDIYSTVAKKVSELVEKDAKEGNENACLWFGKVDRKIAKRPVMTFPYGAKQYGFTDQITEELKERDRKGRYLDIDDNFKPASYLASKLYSTISSVVISAKTAMDWLQNVSRIVCKTQDSIRWTTPTGFRVKQKYMQEHLTRIETFWGTVRLRLGLVQTTDKVDKVHMANAIAPNFVHSLDASHLMKTVNKCMEMGIKDFSMVHDSYGTHAGNIDKMARILREMFVEQYSNDVLNDFREGVIQQVPDSAQEIPPLPQKGNLDLQAVKDSKYFFA